MSYYDGDFYYEPSEFDRQVDEFKASLLKSVKEEYVAEMEQLRAENADLQKVKRDWESIQAEYASRHRQLEYEKSQLESKVRSARLVDLLKDREVTMFDVTWKYEKGPKCDKCNERRHIEFTSPSGKLMSEECECAKSISVSIPRKNVLSEMSNRYGDVTAWYKPYERDDGMTLHTSNVLKQVCDATTPFESIEKYGAFFRTLEDCQAYCDWLNAKAAES